MKKSNNITKLEMERMVQAIHALDPHFREATLEEIPASKKEDWKDAKKFLCYFTNGGTPVFSMALYVNDIKTHSVFENLAQADISTTGFMQLYFFLTDILVQIHHNNYLFYSPITRQ